MCVPGAECQVLLALTNHENMHVACMAMEFWEELREFPLAKRDPRLGRALYARYRAAPNQWAR